MLQPVVVLVPRLHNLHELSYKNPALSNIPLEIPPLPDHGENQGPHGSKLHFGEHPQAARDGHGERGHPRSGELQRAW